MSASDGIRQARSIAKAAMLVVIAPLWAINYFLVPRIYELASPYPVPDSAKVWALNNHGAQIYVSRADFLVVTIAPSAMVVSVVLFMGFFLLVGAMEEFREDSKKVSQR